MHLPESLVGQVFIDLPHMQATELHELVNGFLPGPEVCWLIIDFVEFDLVF